MNLSKVSVGGKAEGSKESEKKYKTCWKKIKNKIIVYKIDWEKNLKKKIIVGKVELEKKLRWGYITSYIFKECTKKLLFEI